MPPSVVDPVLVGTIFDESGTQSENPHVDVDALAPWAPRYNFFPTLSYFLCTGIVQCS